MADIDSSDESVVDLECTPPHIKEAAKNVILNLLPDKSKTRYEREYTLFVQWCKTNQVKSSYSEDILLAYLSEISRTKKSSTIWSVYSMLKSTLSSKHNVDISKYSRLIAFLKKQSVGYRAKKSKVLRREEINRFLSDAPDECYLMLKGFIGRAGTVDEGKNFEELMIISKCLELTFDSNVTDFSISSNDEAFGDFDDLVIRAKYVSGEEEKVALQLKHVLNKDTKVLVPKILGGVNKQFSIWKYYQSYGKVPADFSLILHSNIKFNMPDEKFTMDCRIGEEDIRVDVSKTKEKNRYKFSVNEIETVAKENQEKYEKFLSKFQLKTDQENTNQLEKRLVDEFFKKHGTEDTFHRFKNFIIRWKKKKKENELNKRMVAIKIVELLLSPYVKTVSHELCYTDFGVILRNAILSFRLTTFEETNEVIHKIWIDNKNDKEVIKYGFKNFLLTESLHLMKDEKLKGHKYSIISWHLGHSPLIVEVTKDSKLAIDEAVDLLKKNGIEDRKLLLLGQKEEIWSSGCFRNLNSLKSANQAVYQQILEKFSFSLQGKLYKLEEMVDSEDIEKLINTDCLVKMSNPNFNVGGKPEKLPEFYVPRSLPRILVDVKFLVDEKTDDLIMINCNFKEEKIKKCIKDVRIVEIKELIGDIDDSAPITPNILPPSRMISEPITPNLLSSPSLSRRMISAPITTTHSSRMNRPYPPPFLMNRNLPTVYVRNTNSDENKRTICLHPTKCSIEEYSKIMKRFPSRNCHIFNYRQEYAGLEWINTKGDVKELRSYRTIEEVFEGEDDFFQTSRRNIKVVCADPGMGKTTMLKHFCSLKNKSRWFLHVTARQYASAITEDMDVQDFVFSFANDGLEKKFVETFYRRREIMLLWDGLDEVLDDEQRYKIYSFIRDIEQLGFAQIITSRCNLQEEIEEQFGTLATRIAELAKFEQNEFLKNRLSKKYNDEQLFDLTKTITDNVESLEAEKILGVPLQLYLLTELFLQSSSIDDVIKRPLTATTLLEHFVNNKVKTHFVKFKNEDPFSQKIVKETILRRYKVLGTLICIESIADSTIFEQSDIRDLTAVQDGDDPIGLVKGSGKMSLFRHQCYAEYFAALYLSENYSRITNFQKVYFDDRCRNLRFMLDLILAQDCPAHTAVLYRNLKILEDHKEGIRKEDAAGRNALHIALCWSKEHLVLPNTTTSGAIRNEDYLDKFKMVGAVLKYMLGDKRKLVPVFDKMFGMDYVSYSNESLLEMAVVTNDINVVKFVWRNYTIQKVENCSLPLLYASFIGNDDICKFLINDGVQVNCSAANGGTPCMYAAASGCLDTVKILIDKEADVNMTDSEGRSPLWFAAVNNQLPMVTLLINNKSKLNHLSKHHKNPLVTAAQYGHLEIAKILIYNNAVVNATDSEGRTPLFFATANNQLPLIKLLIEKKADVNLPNKTHTTALMIAAQEGHLDIAKFLIDNKAEVNMTDIEGRSPLWFAAGNTQLPMVALFIENGAKVNHFNKYSKNPLVMAAQYGRLEISKILIYNNAVVNATDSEGRTPLFFATSNNQLPLVELLIAKKADVNLSNKTHTTALMIAAQEGYLDIATSLIDNKAQVNMTDIEGRSPLWFAAANNHLPVVALLIGSKAEVNHENKHGESPLVIAAQHGDLEIARILIDNKANVNMTDSEGRSPLFFAATENKLEVVRLLIETGVEVNLASEDKSTPLNMAAQNGHLDIAKILIENNAEVNLPNKDGFTPLIMATEKGHLDIAKILIDSKAEVNMSETDGLTPLFYAIWTNGLPLIRLLVENDADVNLSNMDGFTPLLVAVEEGLLDVAKILIDNKAEVNMTGADGKSPLFHAVDASNNQLPMVQLLIANDADVNLPNVEGFTPLIIAAVKGHLDIARVLIDNKAEINTTDNLGQTSLFYAAWNNRLPVVQLLLENNAEVNLPSKNGFTPLIIAAEEGHFDIAKILIYSKAEVNMTEIDGQSPLFHAAWNNRLPVVQLLLENNAEVNLPSKNGCTPLIIAAEEGHFDIAKILIYSKAEVNMTKIDGQSPLFHAAWRNHLPVVQLLLENNAEVNLPSKNGCTPLIIAAEEGHFDIAEILIYSKAEVNMTKIDGQSPLFHAAWRNHLPVVQLLLENNAEVNFPSKNGSTPLIIAAEEGHFDIAEILIHSKAEVNMTGIDGQSPLLHAALRGQLPVVQLLLENNAEVNLPSKNGSTPLIIAAEAGYFDIAKILIYSKAEVNMTGIDGQSPLFHAAMQNQLPVVQLLLENDAKVNLPSKNGVTPLIIAAEKGHFDIVQILIDSKAAINMTGADGKSPLFHAVDDWYNHLQMVQLLIANNADVNLPNVEGSNPLIIAAAKGDLDIARVLIDNKAEINTSDNYGQSPLFYAAWNNQLPVVELLIENNAEVNLPSKNGATPLIMAAQEGHLDVAKILIRNKAEVDLTGIDGESPLFHAAEQNQLPLAQLLIENNADVNLPSKDGTTPLIMATGQGHLDIAKILVGNKAEVNMSDSAGLSPLFFAVASNQLPIVRLLINHHANINHSLQEGTTPLMIACEEGYSEIVSYLLEKKANINCTNCDGDTALHLAVQKSNLNLIKLLRQNGADLETKNRSGQTPVELPNLSPEVQDYFRSINVLGQGDGSVVGGNKIGLT